MQSLAPSTSSLRASQAAAPLASSDPASATSSDGSFQDFMTAFVASLGSPTKSAPATPSSQSTGQARTVATNATDAATANGTSTTGLNATLAAFVAALQSAGLSQSDIATAVSKFEQGLATVGKAGKSTKSAADSTDTTSPSAASGSAVPGAVQPQLATLQFSLDPGSIATAAEQAIEALTGSAQGAGSSTTGLASAATASAAATAAATTTASQATLAAAAADPAAQQLGEQGVVSIVGQATTNSAAANLATAAHTIASQSGSPALANANQAQAEVATAALQQAKNSIPLSRMSEIRAKLQAATLGATRAVGSVSASTASDQPVSLETAAAEEGAVPNGVTDPGALKIAAAAATIVGPPQTLSDKDGNDTTDQTVADPSSLADSGLQGVNQAVTTSAQSQQSQTSTLDAVPLSAVGSTLVAQAKAGSSEFSIKLDPAGLGKIDVQMKVGSDGEVRAHLIVDQPATLDLMMRDRQQLQQSLDQAGFKTDPGSLQFSLRDQGQGQNQNPNQGQQTWQGSYITKPVAAVDTSSPPQQTAVYTRPSHHRADGVDLSV